MDFRAVFEASVAAGIRSAAWIDSRRATFPGGTNGPYLDVESPVRNSAHWLATLSIGHHLGLPGTRSVGHAIVAFLLSDHPFRQAGRSIHRQRHPKDWCNGVIGDAWVIEALGLAGDLLEHEEAAAVAIRMASTQPFAPAHHAWERLDPGRNRSGVDWTLNHQLWFAAATLEALHRAADTESGTSIIERVLDLLDHVARGALAIGTDGTIQHHLQPVGPAQAVSPMGLRRTARALRQRVDTEHERLRVERDTGYHLYVLSALSRLRGALPEHPFWQAEELQAALRRASDPGLLASLETNPYAFPYNAPGFALPLIARAFEDLAPPLSDRRDEAWERQLARTWDERSARFVRGTPDPLTLSARVYELGLALLSVRPLPDDVRHTTKRGT